MLKLRRLHGCEMLQLQRLHGLAVLKLQRRGWRQIQYVGHMSSFVNYSSRANYVKNHGKLHTVAGGNLAPPEAQEILGMTMSCKISCIHRTEMLDLGRSFETGDNSRDPNIDVQKRDSLLLWGPPKRYPQLLKSLGPHVIFLFLPRQCSYLQLNASPLEKILYSD